MCGRLFGNLNYQTLVQNAQTRGVDLSSRDIQNFWEREMPSGSKYLMIRLHKLQRLSHRTHGRRQYEVLIFKIYTTQQMWLNEFPVNINIEI